jgi:hypothetical protein
MLCCMVWVGVDRGFSKICNPEAVIQGQSEMQPDDRRGHRDQGLIIKSHMCMLQAVGPKLGCIPFRTTMR